MSSYNSTCQELEAYQDDTCNDGIEPGKLGYIVVKDTSDSWDYTVAAQYESRIAAGTIVKIAVVGGEKPPAEPVTGDGRGFSSARITNQNQTVTFVDNNAVRNVDFYNSLRLQQGTKSLLYVTEGYVWTLSNLALSPHCR